MDRKKIDLKSLTKDDKTTDKIAAHLEGKTDDAVSLWGDEFAASGGKSPPPPSSESSPSK